MDNFNITEITMPTTKPEDTRYSTGSTFQVLDTGMYTAKIDRIYFDKSSSGSIAAVLEYSIPSTGSKHSEKFWIVSKQGKPTFTNKQTGEELPLPAIAEMDNILQIAIGMPLSIAMKTAVFDTVKIYNYDKQAEEDVKRQILPSAKDKEIQFLIRKCYDFKRMQDDAGNWINNLDEIREYNKIEYPLTTDGATYFEKLKGITPKFAAVWLTNNMGKPLDNTNGAYKKTTEPEVITFDPAMKSPF